MKNYEILKAEYTSKLSMLIEESERRSIKLAEEYCTDEANMEKIKMNVADIFAKMFAVSYKNVYEKLSNQNLRKILEPINDDYERLYAANMYFFDTIPEPWKEKLNRAKENNAFADYVIEELKINMAREIQQIFITLYNKNKREGVK